MSPTTSKQLTLAALREAAASCRACDQEDRQGKPFVGPAGRVLDETLQEAGIDRSRVYITNAVKHFKWKPQGKRRLHQKPNAAEINACRPWLDADFRVSLRRGQLIERPGLPLIMATVHPSTILRAPDDETRELRMRAFVQALKRVAQHLRR